MTSLSRLRLSTATTSATRVVRLTLDLVVAYTLFWAAHAAYRGSTGFPQASDSLYSMPRPNGWPGPAALTSPPLCRPTRSRCGTCAGTSQVPASRTS